MSDSDPANCKLFVRKNMSTNDGRKITMILAISMLPLDRVFQDELISHFRISEGNGLISIEVIGQSFPQEERSEWPGSNGRVLARKGQPTGRLAHELGKVNMFFGTVDAELALLDDETMHAVFIIPTPSGCSLYVAAKRPTTEFLGMRAGQILCAM